MIGFLRYIIEFGIAVAIYLLARKKLQQKMGTIARAAFLVLSVCAIFISISVAAHFIPEQQFTIMALNEKNPSAQQAQIYLKSVMVGGDREILLEPAEGQWTEYNGYYCWFDPADSRCDAAETQSITYRAKDAIGGKITFASNEWKGIVAIDTGYTTVTVDTFSGEGETDTTAILRYSPAQTMQALFPPVGVFFVSAAVLILAAYVLTQIGRALGSRIFATHSGNRIVQRFTKYEFLFEELVKRDFKKKYKRTILGMAWSILSPLLTLLVMRLVFTSFFGRHALHYTTYLFCGNLIYAYFNESTTQGMTSLMSNAGIFTKVNVPKYMFLLSKNVQTLINFGLTLCVFFIFCVFDKITFTWKFVLLLYPIVTLVLFNVGVGMILSALYVFFRDIQYLWSIFTLLLMYMSAIFYYIDQYELRTRYLFFANPVYLHIRYFRKIVIDSVIPTAQFHLLMLFDVIVVLLVGRWMYKKYNTEFLYYV